jgi:hypothetical protein
MNTLNDLFIVPDIDGSKAEISFTPPASAKSADWKILDADGGAVCSGRLNELPEQTHISAEISDCKLWSVNSPYLYSFEINFDDGINESIKFGMRSIKVEGKEILINKKPFCARGYIRGREAHDHPNFQNLPLTEYYEKNIKAAKEYGFNLIRFHSRIPAEECFEAADRLGIFIHVEIRKYFGHYQKERAMMSDEGELIDESQWREAILALRNHPSLMVYCMGNEIRHPGCNPFVEHIAKVTKELDPTRLFIDTCAHGEFDRTYVDFDVQHMSYYYPFGNNYDMFENTYNWLIYGSCKGQQLTDSDDEDFPSYKITRAVNSRRPTLAHEICHYIAYRDLDALEKKFAEYAPDQKPWWIDELKKLAKEKGYDKFYDRAMEASRRFQFASWKLGIEAARRSSLLSGFHFLQLSDTERYENSNGLLDCFDDKTGVAENEFLKFNGDTVLLAELPKRTYFENESVEISVLLSHFSGSMSGKADFEFALTDAGSNAILRKGRLDGIDLDERGRREICTVKIRMPECDIAKSLKFTVRLIVEKNTLLENDWQLWAFPDRSQAIPEIDATVSLDEISLNNLYPELKNSGTMDDPAKLMIVNRFSDKVFAHLENGGDVLMLYRLDETRDRKWKCDKEKYYLPCVWDRLKGVIWDRGNNCGAFIEEHPSFKDFPHDGFMNLQFYDLINDCDKVNLDDFPVEVKPVMRGIDRPVRDRFDVYTYELSELQPEWTMRNFAYAFELKVGKGRLYLSSFNFTGLNSRTPECCAMFESLLKYVVSDNFSPETEISVKALQDYLEKKGSEPRLKERKMTQYWQLNAEPLESARYWKESEEYIAGTLNLPEKA